MGNQSAEAIRFQHWIEPFHKVVYSYTMEFARPQNQHDTDKSYNPPSDDIESSLAEGLYGTDVPSLDLDVDEKDLAQDITKAIQSGMALHEEMKPIQDLNEQYYLGQQLDTSMLSANKKVRVIENRAWLSSETLIPVVTTAVPQPIVFAPQDEADFAKNLEKVLMGVYQDQETNITFNIGVRHWMNYRLGVIKMVVDADTGMWETVVVRPQRLVVGTHGITEQELPFIAELVDCTYKELLERFPDKEEKITDFLMRKMEGLEPGEDTPVYYWEYHTNEAFACKLGDIILDSGKNPLYDFDEISRNFVKEPFKPYFFINRIFSLGKTVYDDTTMIEQNKSIQDGINKTHWGIMSDLSDRGVVIGSGEVIGKEEFSKYRGEEGEKIWIEKGRPLEGIGRLQPKTVSAAALAYQERLAARSDDIFGTHATSRGHREGQETARGRFMLKQSDERRTAPISKVLDSTARRLFQAQVQVIKILWDEPKDIPFLDSRGMAEIVAFSSNDVPEKSAIMVREGTMIPEDKETKRDEALQLAGFGPDRIDNLTLFERLGYDDPQEAAKRIYLYQQVTAGNMPPDVLFPGITKEVEEAMQEQQSQGQGQDPSLEDPNVPPTPEDLQGILEGPAGRNVPPEEVLAALGQAGGADSGVMDAPPEEIQ